MPLGWGCGRWRTCHQPTATSEPPAQCTQSSPLPLPMCSNSIPCTCAIPVADISERYASIVHILSTSYLLTYWFKLLSLNHPPIWQTKYFPIPSPKYFLVELHESFIKIPTASKPSTCNMKCMVCKTLVTLTMQLDVWWKNPLSWPAAFIPAMVRGCQAWAASRAPLIPSRPPQWCQKDVWAVFYLGCSEMKRQEGKGSCSTASTSRKDLMLSAHTCSLLFSRDILQRKPAG